MHGVGKFFRAIGSLFRMLAHWQVTLIVVGALVLVVVLIGLVGKLRDRPRPAADVLSQQPDDAAR